VVVKVVWMQRMHMQRMEMVQVWVKVMQMGMMGVVMLLFVHYRHARYYHVDFVKAWATGSVVDSNNLFDNRSMGGRCMMTSMVRFFGREGYPAHVFFAHMETVRMNSKVVERRCRPTMTEVDGGEEVVLSGAEWMA
jgi:cellobiose-specific phosphotransferase system component IIC